MNAKTEKDDDLVAVRSLGDGTGGELQVTEVGSTAGTDTEGLRGSLLLTPRHHPHSQPKTPYQPPGWTLAPW